MPVAFRASNRKLSIFHVERVRKSGSELSDLCLNNLTGAGEAHFRPIDCLEAAKVVVPPLFDPKVYWRPDEVEPDWVTWQVAHANVEAGTGHRNFPQTFRVNLVFLADHLRPPHA